MTDPNKSMKLNLREKLFLRLYCYPPPGKVISDDCLNGSPPRIDALVELRRWFGDSFAEAIKNKIVVDIGCGRGEQIVGIAKNGARLAIGVEMRKIFKNAEAWAADEGLCSRVKFTTDPIKCLGAGTSDIAYSLNAFEHFHNPEKILEDVYYILKHNGKFFVTFGPPWLAPFGVHHFFMIKYPWAHLIFSESTILNIRKLYRDDNASKYEEVDGGLNKMTIKKYEKYVKESGFEFERLDKIPVRGLAALTKVPLLNEFFTSHIISVLIKK